MVIILFFAFCCAGTEFYYIAETALHFDSCPENETVKLISGSFLMLACFCKNLVNLAQLFSGFESIAKKDASG